MDLANIDKHWKEEDNKDIEVGMESKLEWNYHDEEIPMASDFTQSLGMYKEIAISSEARDKERQYEVKWKQKNR